MDMIVVSPSILHTCICNEVTTSDLLEHSYYLLLHFFVLIYNHARVLYNQSLKSGESIQCVK